ncbi:MAG: DUF1571 domain-containing protein [Planctomycetes bacterium]|nr:DUF1571 domain-containing protein [Planctomycetota bacterium]
MMLLNHKSWLRPILNKLAHKPAAVCLLVGLLAAVPRFSAGAVEPPATPAQTAATSQSAQSSQDAVPVVEPSAPVADNQPAAPHEQIARKDGPSRAATPVSKATTATKTKAASTKTAPDLEQALQTARAGRDKLRKTPGYTCTFRKQEQLKKGAALTSQTMALKLRREPFSVYLKFVEPNAGRQVLYVDGRNDGKFYFKEPSGLLSYMGTLSVHPTSSDALKENRYPVTMIGMEKMLERLILDWEASLKHAETQVQVQPHTKLSGLDCTLCEIVHPQQRDAFKFHKTRVYFDNKTNFPIRVEQFAYPAKAGKTPPLVEQYEYLDVKVVEKPTDLDFDVKNPAYGLK